MTTEMQMMQSTIWTEEIFMAQGKILITAKKILQQHWLDIFWQISELLLNTPEDPEETKAVTEDAHG